MRIGKAIIAAGLLVTGLSLASCHNGRPGRWDDHHGHHHGHDHDGDHHRR